MTLCGIWVKADNGRWFDDPEIGGADWRLLIDEFGDDELHIRAVKDNGQWKRAMDPEQLIESLGLPIELKLSGGGFRGSHGVLGRTVMFVTRPTRLPFPRAVILNKGDGHARPKHGTFVGCSHEESNAIFAER